jgi:glycosyltransferase involved in cell wall biosynthesis
MRGNKKSMKATVVIPTKDRPKLLQRAVSSALSSSVAQDEVCIIVVDDNSHIPAIEILAGYRGAKLKVISNDGSPGPAGARNAGVRAAESDIVFFLDDDDQLLPAYIDSVLSARDGTARSAEYGFSSLIIGSRIAGTHGPTGLRTQQSKLGDRLGGLGAGFWITRKAFRVSGGIDERLRVNEDLEFCIRLAAQGYNCWYSADPGVSIRSDMAGSGDELPSVTRSSRSQERAAAFEWILERHAEFLTLHPLERMRIIRRAVKYKARSSGFLHAMAFGRSQSVPPGRIVLDAVAGALTKD